MTRTCGIVILAAGNSSRLGQPKQQLLYKGQTLLQHTIIAALQSDATAIVAVLGANAGAMLDGLQHKDMHIVVNDQWEHGMSSSIYAGVNEMLRLKQDIDSILFLVCDQPFISTDLLNNLINAGYDKSIVASRYGETAGVPARFHKDLFPELLQLKGHEGARTIIRRYRERVTTIPFPEGVYDIDTMEDYKRLIS